MENGENKNPTRIVLAFFRWFCHPDLREESSMAACWSYRRSCDV